MQCPQVQQGNNKPRKNFDEKPKFGTVESNIFKKGEEGLLAGPNDDENGDKKEEAPEWEKRLNFGETKKRP